MIIGILLGIISGVLTGLTYPKHNLWFLTWFSFLPLLFALSNKKFYQAAIIAFMCGLTSNTIVYYWIVNTCMADGQSFLFGVLALAALCVYLSVFYALSGGLFAFFANRLLANERPVFFILSAASAWVAVEYSRGYLFTGFPWMLVGHSLWANTALIQSADTVGVYGLSFLILTVNLLLYAYILKKADFKYLITCAAVLGMLYIAGSWKIKNINSDIAGAESEISVTLIQPSIDQYKKWDQKFESEILTVCRELSEEAAGGRPDLAVWPETTMPYAITRDGKNADDWIKDIISPLKCYNLIGSLANENNKLYNSAYLLNSDARLLGRYDKVHLLPFGEYIPFEKLLLRHIEALRALGGFSPGVKIEPMRAGIHQAGATICYEGIFPYISRALVAGGADFLVNLTNDAWFLKTSAPYQHLAMNVFRAVENRRYVVRCANTGISAFIEPTGAVVKQSAIFERVVLNHSFAPLKYGQSFYTRHGDIFVLILIGFSSIISLLCIAGLKGFKWTKL